MPRSRNLYKKGGKYTKRMRGGDPMSCTVTKNPDNTFTVDCEDALEKRAKALVIKPATKPEAAVEIAAEKKKGQATKKAREEARAAAASSEATPITLFDEPEPKPEAKAVLSEEDKSKAASKLQRATRRIQAAKKLQKEGAIGTKAAPVPPAPVPPKRAASAPAAAKAASGAPAPLPPRRATSAPAARPGAKYDGKKYNVKTSPGVKGQRGPPGTRRVIKTGKGGSKRRKPRTRKHKKSRKH